MYPTIVNLVLMALVLLLTYALSSEGLWGAALMFFNVLFAALIAFNFYEPLAQMLATSATFLSGFADTLCLMSLFCVALVVFRLTTESLAPAMVRFPAPVYQIGRFGFALAGGALTVAFLIVALETAPVHKKILGAIDYKAAPPFGMGFDHKFLGFFQYSTGSIFASYGKGQKDPRGEFGDRGAVPLNFFDPKGEWLIVHQEARPYGDDKVIAEEGAAEGGAAAPAAATPGKAAPPPP